MGEIRPPLTKMVLNNFVVQKRPVVRQAKIHIINGLVHSTRRLRKKMEKDEGQCNKLEAKADRLVKEVLFIKTVPPDEIMKFALLNNKSFAIVGSNPQSKIEERAMCRIVEHKAIKDAIAGLKEAHADWSQDLPHLIKGLGVRNREKKLERLKRRGKLDAYLKKEHRNMRLLQELTGIDLKANDDAASGVTNDKEKKKKSGGSSRSRKRKREQNLDEQTLKIVKKKGKVAEGMKKQSTGAGVNGEDSEVDGEENDDDGGSLIKKMGVDEQEENSEDDVMESDSDSEDLSSGNNNNDATDESEELDEEYDDDSDKSDMDDDSQKPLTICNGNESPMKTVDEQKLNGKLSLGKIEMKGKKEKNIGKKKEDMNMGKPAQPVITNTLKKAEVKQLYLKNMEAFGKDDDLSKTEENGTIDLNEDDDDDEEEEEEEEGEDEEDKEDEDEDEEDFFELGVKKKAKSSFFLGGTDDHEEDDNDDDDDDDDDAVDTSKYFKRNLYREGRGGRSGMKKEERFGGKSWEEDDGERNGFTERRGRGRGGFSDRRGGRDSFGDGRGGRGGFGDRRGGRGGFGDRRGGRGGFGDREDGRERDESSDRGGRGNFTERGGRGRGESSDRRGRGNFLKRGGRGRGESSDRRGRGNFTERGGRGRGESGDRRERGNFGERGGRGESGGRSGGSFSNRRGGGRGRGQSGDRRGGRGRGRFGRGGGFGQMNSDNPNLIPLTSASTGTSPSFPASTSRPQTSLLHPSWMAKKKERLQSSAVNAFQGKRVVFD